MSDRCNQELCANWGGDGDVCPCALFSIEPVPLFDEYNHSAADYEDM